jgi:hypothetical protein
VRRDAQLAVPERALGAVGHEHEAGRDPGAERRLGGRGQRRASLADREHEQARTRRDRAARDREVSAVRAQRAAQRALGRHCRERDAIQRLELRARPGAITASARASPPQPRRRLGGASSAPRRPA